MSVKVIGRIQKLPLAGKELNTEQLLDATLWLKPWLKSILFGSNVYHLAKVLATTNFEPGLALLVNSPLLTR